MNTAAADVPIASRSITQVLLDSSWSVLIP
jgi:hypothetical protein